MAIRHYQRSLHFFISRATTRKTSSALLAAIVLLILLMLNPKPDGIKSENTLSIPLGSNLDAGGNRSGKESSFIVANYNQSVDGSMTLHRLMTSKVIPYGSSIGQVGMIRTSGGSWIGAESFGFDSEGNLAIGDLINRRMLFFSENGEFIAATDLSGFVINDFFVDSCNQIYVFSQSEMALVQYNSRGSEIAALSLSGLINTRGYFHLEGDSVYHAEACERDVLIGKIKEGKLRGLTESEGMKTEGIVTESGCACLVKISRLKAVSLSVSPLNGDQALECKIDTPGVVSARFIGEDKHLNRYVQIERIHEGTDHQILLSVIKFDKSGAHSTFECAENDYESWTSRLLVVRKDGAVLQFIPQRRQAKINLYKDFQIQLPLSQ